MLNLAPRKINFTILNFLVARLLRMELHNLKSALRVARIISNMAKLVWNTHPASFLGMLILEFVLGILPLGIAWATKMIFDLLSDNMRGNLSTSVSPLIIFLLVLQVILGFSHQLVGQLNTYLNAGLIQRLTLTIQITIYEKINSLIGLAPFEVPEFHDQIRLATESAFNGPLRTVQNLTTLFRSIITLISFIGILIAFNPFLIGMILIAVLPQIFVEFNLGRQRFSLSMVNNTKERQASYFGHILSGAKYAKEVRLFNLSGYFLNKFRFCYEEIHKSWRQQQKKELRSLSLLYLVSRTVYGIAFIVIIYQAFAGYLSIGDVTLYDNAVLSMQLAALGIISTVASLRESALFYERYDNLMKIPQNLYLSNSKIEVPILKMGIELRNVSFRYSESYPWILRNVNLFIPANKCTALVGLNGAGKTTLVKLLTRCYDPISGEILWDGVNIREMDPIRLRQQIGVVFQDFLRYELTVKENIGLGYVDDIENLARISDAAKQAGISKVIEELPRGYQTTLSRWLGDNDVGVDLSGGEWQKIALARMFMRSETSEFLILDEPSAALDAIAEHELFEHFTNLMSDRTTLLISHRFSTVRMAETIAVLEKGRVTEYGTHEELIASGKSYSQLYKLQARKFN